MLQSFIFSDLPDGTTKRLIARLNELGMKSALDNLYWLPVPNVLLSSLQMEHYLTCGPYRMALELDKNTVTLELLTRALNTLHCECIAPASAALRTHMIDWLDGFILAAITLPHEAPSSSTEP